MHLPPSGPWSGYYLYGFGGAEHRMQLYLTFSQNGNIDGDGFDDIGEFSIRGVFDPTSREARWTKAYVRGHSVEYRGTYDQKCISGTWTLTIATGGFRIWPGVSAEGEEAEG